MDVLHKFLSLSGTFICNDERRNDKGETDELTDCSAPTLTRETTGPKVSPRRRVPTSEYRVLRVKPFSTSSPDNFPISHKKRST